jgi:hypothetical protein
MRRLSKDCDVASVRAFDFGIPCTFYGFATSTWVEIFSPVRGLVYWHPLTWKIEAPGIGVPCRLTIDEAELARGTVLQTVERLRAAIGYVGAFGTDGTIGGLSYTIHEINPRVCAGFSFFDQASTPAVPLAAIDLVLRELESLAARELLQPLSRYVETMSLGVADQTWIFGASAPTPDDRYLNARYGLDSGTHVLLSEISKDFKWK